MGVDTSNYSTSVACYDAKQDIFFMDRRLLPVQKNSIGLRQSDAVFFHIKQFSEIFQKVTENMEAVQLGGIGCSVVPRRTEGSYMPCFLVGKAVAESLAFSHRTELYECSHQEGHIAAALYSSGALRLLKRRFIAFHVSGGTTEALLVEPDDSHIFKISVIAQSLDLKAGQLIDRVGVMLGLSFPAGPQLEQLASSCGKAFRVRPSLKGHDICLSGAQNQCEAMLNKGAAPEEVAAYALEYVRCSLDCMAASLQREYGGLPLVFAGGVMSNRGIRTFMQAKYQAYFAEPAFSADNAAGVAYLAYLKGTKM